MLFGYPGAATGENWLHECLVAAVNRVHAHVGAGDALPAWPGVLPDEYRDALKNRRGLRDRISIYKQAIEALGPESRGVVLAAMTDQNRIAELLRCDCECPQLSDLPESVREAISSLFGFAYELLSDFGVRQRQYELIHSQIRYRICPFCGCEYFDSPRAPQEDFDHYLAQSRYPFAAANLRNLAPMGGKCNSKYKLAKDILRRDDGTRRRAFDPYATSDLRISLENSEISEAVDGPFVSNWAVEFQPALEEAETWDEVFAIRERYRRDILEDRTFRDWLWDFRNWCVERAAPPGNDQDVVNAVASYERILSASGYNDRAFLKAAVFRFLLFRANAGCQRVLALLRDLAGLAQSAMESGGAEPTGVML